MYTCTGENILQRPPDLWPPAEILLPLKDTMDNNETLISMVPVTCHLSKLQVLSGDHPEQILMADQPFSVQVQVEFSGNGAVALLSLAPDLQVDFFAKPLALGDGVDLGTATVATAADQLRYGVSLSFKTPTRAGLDTRGVYSLGTLLRVGSPDGPALLCGALEAGKVEIYSAEASRNRRNGRSTAAKRPRLVESEKS
jgi:hypothetical protein